MIGRRIEVGCLVQGTRTSCLWDTGSQLSLVSIAWLKSNLQVHYSTGDGLDQPSIDHCERK